MGRRKRKDSEDFVVHRKIMPAPQRNRIVTVHTTPSGRLGQATSFVSARIASQPSTSTATVGSSQLPSPDDMSTDAAPNDSFQESFTEYPDSNSDLGNTSIPISNPDPPLLDWMRHHRDTYLDELIRHDGRGGTELCANCGATGLFKCKDCFGYRLLCQKCFTDAHVFLPFHRPLVCLSFLVYFDSKHLSQPQYWTGQFFDDVSLKSLGVKLKLGHCGSDCRIPHESSAAFTVVDITGVHVVDVEFCGCYASVGGSHPRNQLLRAGLFPATHTRPTTAFTFEVLDTFHLLTLQGKISAYDFYHSLAHKSDNTGTMDTKVRSISGHMRCWTKYRHSNGMTSFCAPFACGDT